MAVIRGDVAPITIGAHTNIQDGAVLHVTHASPYAPIGHPLVIGDRVTVGHKAVLHGCQIGSDVLIGMNSTVLDGAIIQAQALIGAGSLVPPNKEIAGGYLWLGNPVQQIRPLTSKEKEYFAYSAAHYVALKKRYESEQQTL